MTSSIRRHTATATIALLGCAGMVGVANPIEKAHAASPRAASARTLNVNDTAHLRYVEESGSYLLEEGAATGALPGTVRVRFNVGATVIAGFTIYTRYGSISGRGTGRLKGTGTWASFGGTMEVRHGTGRYAHAHGRGGFYGVINRYHYNAVVQTTGTLSY